LLGHPGAGGYYPHDFLSKGFTWRLQQDQLELAHLQDFPTFERDMPVTDAPVGFQLVGDSLAGQYIADFGSLTSD
jgi:hypothetical protein